MPDRQLVRVLLSQLLWLGDIVRQHVQHALPDDIADAAGRRLSAVF